jgi:hypothetical protein
MENARVLGYTILQNMMSLRLVVSYFTAVALDLAFKSTHTTPPVSS